MCQSEPTIFFGIENFFLMTTQQLLDDVESVPYGERVRRMVHWGREALENAEIGAAFSELRRGNFYERWLALMANYGVRNSDDAVAALGDESRMIRRCAQKQLVEFGTDTQVNAMLENSAPLQRTPLLQALWKVRRVECIDTFLAHLEARADSDLARLMAYGSDATVDRLLPAVIEMLDTDGWRRMAKFHPALVATRLLAQAENAPAGDVRLLWQVKAVLPLLSKRVPEKALALVTAMIRTVPVSQFDLSILMRRFPNETAELALQVSIESLWTFCDIAHRMDDAYLHALLRSGQIHSSLFYSVLKKLPPSRRETAFDAGFAPDAVLPASILSFLPARRREQEALRHLALPQFAATPSQRLPYAAYLPWDELTVLVEPYLKNPDAELRSSALMTLGLAVPFQRERLTDLLAIYRARPQEQDPVRMTMMVGLSQIPVPAFHGEHLESLDVLLRAMLDAKDRSATTTQYAQTLILRLLPVFPEWAAPWLQKLVKAAGQLHYYPFADKFNRQEIALMSPHLLPVFASWLTREREGILLSALEQFGRRLRDWQEGTELLESLLERTGVQHNAVRALHLLHAHARRRFAALVPELLTRDLSWGILSPVNDFLHRKRQDLLTPFLGRQAFKGKFSTGRTRFVLNFESGFQRWTATQQKLFAQTVTEVLADKQQEHWSAMRSIQQLAALPMSDPAVLIRLAGDGSDTFRQSLAFDALADLDTDAGLPTFLDALADERAFFAVYALRKRIAEMPVERAFGILSTASMQKITVAKEILRLIGTLRSEPAFQFLREHAAQENLHRDVRVALLRALWDFRDRAETWDILQRAAESADVPLAQMTGRTPADGLNAQSQARLLQVIHAGLSHASPEVRIDLLHRLTDLPVNDAAHVLLPRLQTLSASTLPQERTLSAQAILAVYGEADLGLLADLFRTHLSNRRLLQTLYDALLSRATQRGSYAAPMVRAVLSVLETDPVTATLRITLIAAALPIQEIIAATERMAQTRELHADALTELTGDLTYSRRLNELEMDTLERAFAASADRYVRRVGLAMLLRLAQTSRGWDTELRSRLQTYRADESALVAAAAQFTFLPDEV